MLAAEPASKGLLSAVDIILQRNFDIQNINYFFAG